MHYHKILMMNTNKKTTIDKIQNQITSIESLNPSELNSQIFKDWNRNTEIVIDNIFGSGSHQLKAFAKIKYRPAIRLLSSHIHDQTPLQIDYFKKGLEEARTTLKSFVNEIEEYWRDNSSDSSTVGINKVFEFKLQFPGFVLNINELIALVRKYFRDTK